MSRFLTWKRNDWIKLSPVLGDDLQPRVPHDATTFQSRSAFDRRSLDVQLFETRLGDNTARRLLFGLVSSFHSSHGKWAGNKQFNKANEKICCFFSVDTELKECGLPSWLVSRPMWTTMDSRMQLEMRGGGSRRFTLTTTRRKRKSRKRLLDKLDKLDKLDNREDEHGTEGGGGETDKVSSHMTCHNIVHQNATFVKLVVYQKLEW